MAPEDTCDGQAISVAGLEPNVGPTPASQPRSTMVILDSSTWINQNGLRSASGTALIHRLKLSDGKLGFPEVVEMEVMANLAKRAKQALDHFNSSARTLQAITGKVQTQSPLNAESIHASIVAWIDMLTPLLTRMPITEQDARKAVRRAVCHQPPNTDKDEQVRDSLIWLTVVASAASNLVYFLSDDSHFSKDRNPNSGIHPDLIALAVPFVRNVRVARNFGQLLDWLTSETTAEVDRDALAGKIDAFALQTINTDARRLGFVVLDRQDAALRFYATDDPEKLSVLFDLTYRLEDSSARDSASAMEDVPADFVPQGRVESSVSVNGDCFYAHSNGQITDVRIDTMTFVWVDQANTPQQKRYVFLEASSARIARPRQTIEIT